MSSMFYARFGIGKRHRDPWLGLSYLVCLGRDLWRELVSVVEAETWSVACIEEDSSDEEGRVPQIDEAQPRDCDVDIRCHSWLDLTALPAVRPRQRHWAMSWDEDVLWGDLDRESRRRLRRLLGGDLK
jgi:hypothetical protein